MTISNKLIRIGFILGITFCLLLVITQVKANTFAEVTAGYGYSLYDNGTTGSRTWVGYNSNNLVNYGYNLGSTRYYEIDEFNIRFRPIGGFQRGSSYTITFTWYNGHANEDITNFYPDWLLMTHNLLCYSSSWSSSSQSGSNCFTSSNVYATDISSSDLNTIIVTITLVPSADFYGLVLVNQHGSTFTYYKSAGWEVYDVSYSYSTDGSQDIINNANQNTQNIINNQDSNTQDIIDNQNQNTQAIIDSNKSCQIIDKNSIFLDNSAINSSGVIYSNSNYGVTNYINVYGGQLKVLLSSGVNSCFFDINKTFISCQTSTSVGAGNYYTLPSNAYYFRTSINKSTNLPQFQLCKDGSQAVQDTLTDDDVSSANSEIGNFFSGFTETDHGGISGIVTAPLVVVNSMLTTNQCQDLNFQVMNTNVSFPSGCILWNVAPANIVTIWQTIVCGFVSYLLLKKLFKDIEDLKNPQNSEVSTLDL